MPVHDWTRAEAGIFHHFHQQWISELSAQLNTGGLPRGYFALIEQRAGAAVPYVIAFERNQGSLTEGEIAGGGIALAAALPKTRFVMSADVELYASKASRIAIRHPLGEVVAVLEIVSPGNKDSRNALSAFVGRSLALLNGGIHLSLVDLLPPTKRDPQGIHGAIWDQIQETRIALPRDKPLTLASYSAGPPKTAYVEPVAVGDPLPSMPLFLSAGLHIPLPLDETYRRTWELCPQAMRELLQPTS